jgi:hypothetical protein
LTLRLSKVGNGILTANRQNGRYLGCHCVLQETSRMNDPLPSHDTRFRTITQLHIRPDAHSRLLTLRFRSRLRALHTTLYAGKIRPLRNRQRILCGPESSLPRSQEARGLAPRPQNHDSTNFQWYDLHMFTMGGDGALIIEYIACAWYDRTGSTYRILSALTDVHEYRIIV